MLAFAERPSKRVGAVSAREIEQLFFSVGDVAVMTGVSDDTIRRAISEGELTAFKVRGQLRIRKSDMEAWLGRCRYQPKDRLTEVPKRAPIRTSYRW